MRLLVSNSLSYLLVSIWAFTSPAIAQTNTHTASAPSLVSADTGPLPTPAELLARHHISLTKEALVKALDSDEAEVRSLAAEQLAAEGATDTIPAIYEALEAERSSFVRLNMASQIASLGDPRGVQALQEGCDDKKLSMMDRLQATEYLLDVRQESCSQVLLLGLQATEPGVRVQAVSLIPRFKRLSPDESAEVKALLLKLLWDPDPSVKIAASDTLRTVGDISAVSMLESAISKEQDLQVRTAMQESLRALRDTKP